MSAITETPAAESRQRLLEAAAEAFREEGYRASVERIAARAGVARQTLYNHFPAKQDLFAAVVRAAVSDFLVILDAGDGDLRASLVRFATVYRRQVLSPDAIAMFRALAAETARFPELGHELFTHGPQETVRRLAGLFERAMARGELRRDDPLLAAEMLTGALTNYDRLRALLNLDPDVLSDADKAGRVVDNFLRAYAPERTRP